MKTNTKPATPTKSAIVAGKSVKVATSSAVKESSSKIQVKYSKALENLKNR